MAGHCTAPARLREPGRLPVTTVATPPAGGTQALVGVAGCALVRPVGTSTNAVTAHAIADAIADRTDPRLRRGQVARLSPRTNVH